MRIGFLPCVEPWRLKDKVVVPVIIDYDNIFPSDLRFSVRAFEQKAC